MESDVWCGFDPPLPFTKYRLIAAQRVDENEDFHQVHFRMNACNQTIRSLISSFPKVILLCDRSFFDTRSYPSENRFNYVRWIQALLDTTTSAHDDAQDTSRHVSGLDM